MKMDFTQKLIGYDGLVINTPERPGDNNSPLIEMTLSVASVRALTALNPNAPNPSGDEKFKCGELARKIYNSSADGIDLPVEDLALIKKMIGIAFGPVVVEAAWPILDARETAK